MKTQHWVRAIECVHSLPKAGDIGDGAIEFCVQMRGNAA
jgi:hypothetical protein